MKRTITTLGTLAIAIGLSACQGGGSEAGTAAAGRSAAAVGTGCSSPDSLCLAVKYVSYDEGKGAISSETQAARDMAGVNQIWSACGIEFKVEEYQVVNPATYGLGQGSSAPNQTDTIRKTFNDGKTLLIVYTGYWGTTKNAWTNMPGFTPYGAIFESTVVDYPNIVAHELGHYLGLDHVNDSSNVLSALIYTSSTGLTAAQCATARQVAQSSWKAMLR